MSSRVPVRTRSCDRPREQEGRGVHLRSGTAVELLGILAEGVLGTDASVVSPIVAPNTVLFRATAPGNAVIDVVTGDPWRSPVTHRVEIRVER